MKVNVSGHRIEFSYESSIKPEIGEVIHHKGQRYTVRQVAHIVNDYVSTKKFWGHKHRI